MEFQFFEHGSITHILFSTTCGMFCCLVTVHYEGSLVRLFTCLALTQKIVLLSEPFGNMNDHMVIKISRNKS